jgi:hypothetical protein
MLRLSPQKQRPARAPRQKFKYAKDLRYTRGSAEA